MFRKTVAVSTLLVLGAVGDPVCISNPPNFVWTKNAAGENVGHMEMVPHVLELTEGNVQTRAWKDVASPDVEPYPPATMRMRRNERYRLVVRNGLPEGATSTEHNVFKDPNVINLHTHGLHISGEMPADDVSRKINPGQCGEFVYDIPDEHLGGTHFYHPHHHGSTYVQTAGGAVGMIIIEDDAVIDDIPQNVLAMEELEVHIHRLDGSASGSGGDTLFWNLEDGISTLDVRRKQQMLVNGIEPENAEICLAHDTWMRLRIMLFEPGSFTQQLRLIGTEGADAPCELQLMARDGIWRTQSPKKLNNTYFMPASTRVDLALKCTGPASLVMAKYTARTDEWGAEEPLLSVRIDDSKTTNAVVGPFSEGATGGQWTSRRPDYAPPGLAYDEGPMDHTEFMGPTLSKGFTVQTGNPSVKADDTLAKFFDASAPNNEIEYKQDWKVEYNPLKSGDHSFHMHIWPITPVEWNTAQGDCGEMDYEIGEFYDVWRCEGKARFYTVRFAGTVVLHCHMVFHEDVGLMGWLNVTGPGHPDNVCPESNLYTCSDAFNGYPDECAETTAPSSSPTSSQTEEPTASEAPTTSSNSTTTPTTSDSTTTQPTSSDSDTTLSGAAPQNLQLAVIFMLPMLVLSWRV